VSSRAPGAFPTSVLAAVKDADAITTGAFRLCLAPMMDRTDRHFRYFLRAISPRVRLYTEMVTAGAIVHGDRERHLGFDAAEHPVALQIGGSEPDTLALAARVGGAFGYDEINLNCGCPSDRVRSGRFGACLLAEPALVAECVNAMREAVDVPVTVKTRIALDRAEPREMLWPFVERVHAAGVDVFIVHARPAWLEGLSPKENREVPPLDYDVVAALGRDFPDLTLVLNGGIASVETVTAELARFDGVMLGRAAYDDPYLFARLDAAAGLDGVPTRAEVMARFLPYACMHIETGAPPRAVLRHVLGLYQGLPGARAFRRRITEALASELKAGVAPPATLARRALALVEAAVGDIETLVS